MSGNKELKDIELCRKGVSPFRMIEKDFSN